MHDALAHRLSMLSLQAGAVELRPTSAPEDLARAAGVVRSSAHLALEELRTVVGVLRRADLVVVGEAGDGAEGCRQAEVLRPDVVLMDIRMPGTDGLTATEALRATHEPPEVIVLTTFDTDEHILHALRAGAAGFLLKDTPPADIVSAIHRVAAGDAQLSPSVTRRLIATAVATQPRAQAARERLATLTARELDIAHAIGEGLSNAEIGARLYLSVPTVKAHVSAVLDKLEAGNRVQVALLVHDAETG
ncbi:MAG: response regulator [Acidimicrobiales bacterium]